MRTFWHGVATTGRAVKCGTIRSGLVAERLLEQIWLSGSPHSRVAHMLQEKLTGSESIVVYP
jgi:hypothetical protein